MSPTELPQKSENPNPVAAPKKPKKVKKIPQEVVPPRTTARGELMRQATLEKASTDQARMSKIMADLEEKREKAKAKASEKVKESSSTQEEKSQVPKKPVKKTIPCWATLTSSSLSSTKKVESVKHSVTVVHGIIDSIQSTKNSRGIATFSSMKKYFLETYSSWNKANFKIGLKKALEKELVSKVSGGAYKCVGKVSVDIVKKETLEDCIPHIFTWVCEPKEASAGLIKKYIEKHYPRLDTENKTFKKALEQSESKGQLDRITGKGACGTFALVDGAKKTGARYENAFEDAIIAMNEPKEASVQALRHYLSEFNTEFGVKEHPKVLKNVLDKLEAKGHILRVSGKGFSGTFRLAYPYYPSPRELWKEDYEPDEENNEPMPKMKRSKTDYYSEDEDDEDFQVVVKKKKKSSKIMPSIIKKKQAKPVKQRSKKKSK